MGKLTDKLESIIELGADLEKRVIYLYGDVDGEMSKKALAALSLLDRQKGPITVVIDSPGGDEYEGWAIIDAFCQARQKVLTIGYGQVMSMAAALLQMGDERRMAPCARFMIHPGSQNLGDAHSNVVIAAGKEQEINNRRYSLLFSDRIIAMGKRRPDVWPKGHGELAASVYRMSLEETFLSADEALQYGFIDAIHEGPLP